MIDLSARVAGGDFSWSNSKHTSFEECRRKFFLENYAAKVDPEIKRLSKLSAIPLWAGNVVHDYMETFIKSRAPIPGPEEIEVIVRDLVGQMRQDWRFSLSKSKSFRLYEHEYNHKDADDVVKPYVELVGTCIRNAFASDVLKEITESRLLTCEELIGLKVAGVNCFGKMDAAYLDANDKVKIVDWKTGKHVGNFNKNQVTGYALYALNQKWAKRPEDVETILAYLYIPQYDRHIITENDLKGQERFVAESVYKIKAMLVDADENVGRAEDFPQCGKAWSCQRCKFQKVCFP